jgi:hypothetical protein
MTKKNNPSNSRFSISFFTGATVNKMNSDKNAEKLIAISTILRKSMRKNFFVSE